MKSRILATKIATWLRQRDGNCFCDNCIASEMTEGQTGTACVSAEPECNRFRAKCAACGDAAVVTMARRNLGVA